MAISHILIKLRTWKTLNFEEGKLTLPPLSVIVKRGRFGSNRILTRPRLCKKPTCDKYVTDGSTRQPCLFCWLIDGGAMAMKMVFCYLSWVIIIMNRGSDLKNNTVVISGISIMNKSFDIWAQQFLFETTSLNFLS